MYVRKELKGWRIRDEKKQGQPHIVGGSMVEIVSEWGTGPPWANKCSKGSNDALKAPSSAQQPLDAARKHTKLGKPPYSLGDGDTSTYWNQKCPHYPRNPRTLRCKNICIPAIF